MDIAKINFERILKTHYFLFTSSSSLCAVLTFVVSYDCHPYFISSLACSLEIANFETRISSCGLQISSGNFIVVWVKLNPEWQCSAWNWEKTLLPVSVVWQYGLWSFQMGYTILERFLHKNQHTQRKLLNFESWTNGEPQNLKISEFSKLIILIFYVKNLKN